MNKSFKFRLYTFSTRLLATLFLSLLVSIQVHAQSARLLTQPDFVMSTQHSQVKSPLKNLLRPPSQDYLITYDFDFQMQKDFDSIQLSQLESNPVIKTLSAAKEIQHPNPALKTWKLLKTAKSFGMTIAINYTADQFVVHGNDPTANAQTKQWLQSKFGKTIDLNIENNEIILIQRAYNFDKMFSAGVILLRIQKQNPDFVKIKIENIFIFKKSALLPFVNTPKILEQVFTGDLNLLLSELPKVW